MAHAKAMPDAIDHAIAAAAEPSTIKLARIQVVISSTQRPAAIEIPVDATDAELAELCGWMLATVMGQLRTQRQAPASRIILPS